MKDGAQVVESLAIIPDYYSQMHILVVVEAVGKALGFVEIRTSGE